MLRHDKIDKAVVINVAPDRVAPGSSLKRDHTRFRRYIAELLGNRYRREGRDEAGRRGQE